MNTTSEETEKILNVLRNHAELCRDMADYYRANADLKGGKKKTSKRRQEWVTELVHTECLLHKCLRAIGALVNEP